MSDTIPFEIQEEIMKKLPVKSLIRCRSISKQWKSVIDSSNFIKSYHVNHANPQHHLLVEYKSDIDEVKYISIIDDNTFPNHKFSLTFPQQQDLSFQFILGSSQGIVCIYGDMKYNEDNMAVLWNPTIRKTVGVVIPGLPTEFLGGSGVSFGVCPNTNDPKLVQVNVSNIPTIKWEAKVFTLSTKVWKTVTIPSTLFHNLDLDAGCGDFCTQGFIYFLAFDTGTRSKMIVSFDLRSEEFAEVYLPDGLVHSRYMYLSKQNECLTLLEAYNNVNDVQVWMMTDHVTKSFTKIFTLKSLVRSGWPTVFGFRKNGKAIIRTTNVVDDDTGVSSAEVYDQEIYYPSHVNSYRETLLLFDQADSLIY